MEQNLSFLHTKGVHRSNLRPLLVNHTLHGRCNNKNCNTNEDNHKGIRKCLMLVKLTVKSRQSRY